MSEAPFRAPEVWSAAWFYQLYDQVLSRQGGGGEVTDAELDAAVELHNASPTAHGGIPPEVDTVAIEMHSFFLGQ
jgi:hypothetical protein